MTKRVAEIRSYILKNVSKHPADIVNVTASQFHITRQAAARHVRQLVNNGTLTANGKTKARKYELKKLVDEIFHLDVTQGFEEDVIWRQNVLPLMTNLPKNVLDICQYGVTEILNNVLAHSEAAKAWVKIERDAALVTIQIYDYGVGIFNKIQRAFNLHDPRHALLELTKGKLTSEQAHHTGEGIFFTSRMFDEFSILSSNLFFDRVNKQDDDWLIEVEERNQSEGTLVTMKIHTQARQTTLEIFTRATSGELGHDFSRTHVPVKLARYDTEQLVSRSQARRILARFDQFKEVLLDFQGIAEIGPAFADEIFRVYQNEHPEIHIRAIRALPQVQQTIYRTKQAIEV